MVNGERTRRSQLDADSLTAALGEEGIARLRGEAELTLVLDGMERRRAGATAQKGLMRVKGWGEGTAGTAVSSPVQQPAAGFPE
ncbi:MAG: hypothetical protein CUN53_02005 [Phototrophicales bacterium]|nr:MAG: hypothetical protein CUN53_02005 [Phototrophicales bacterium]